MIPSEVIINVASEVQSFTGDVGISWQLQKEDVGTVFAEARLYSADHQGCFAELQVVQLALQAANRWKVKKVEVRLDVKAIVVWLQKRYPSFQKPLYSWQHLAVTIHL